MKIVIDILTFIFVLSICAFIAWCGGYNFDCRGPEVGFGVGVSLFMAIMVIFCSEVDENDNNRK